MIQFINKSNSGGGFPPDWTLIGYENTPDVLIEDFNYSKNIYDNWDSSQTNLNYKFQGDANLKYVPFIDTSNATSCAGTFNNCSNLLYVPKINTEKVTNMATMFNACSLLKNLPLLDTKNVTNMNNIVNWCANLSNESLNNVLKMCINATQYSQTKTLQAIGIKQNQISTIQGLSNYQDFLNAGWSDGY